MTIFAIIFCILLFICTFYYYYKTNPYCADNISYIFFAIAIDTLILLLIIALSFVPFGEQKEIHYKSTYTKLYSLPNSLYIIDCNTVDKYNSYIFYCIETNNKCIEYPKIHINDFNFIIDEHNFIENIYITQINRWWLSKLFFKDSWFIRTKLIFHLRKDSFDQQKLYELSKFN